MDEIAWGSIATIAAGSSAVAAVVSFGLGWIKDAHQKNQQLTHEAQFDAIHLIAHLDLLALNCAKSYWNFVDAMSEYKAASWGNPNYPKCSKPEYKIERSDLKRIDQATAAQIAWLDNEYILGREMILIKMDFTADPPDTQEELANLVGHYGFRAMELANGLRKMHKLQTRDIAFKVKNRLVDETLIEASTEFRKFLSSMN